MPRDPCIVMHLDNPAAELVIPRDIHLPSEQYKTLFLSPFGVSDSSNRRVAKFLYGLDHRFVHLVVPTNLTKDVGLFGLYQKVTSLVRRNREPLGFEKDHVLVVSIPFLVIGPS
jgi:hypothetical protein